MGFDDPHCAVLTKLASAAVDYPKVIKQKPRLAGNIADTTSSSVWNACAVERSRCTLGLGFRPFYSQADAVGRSLVL